jgi:hypothetical protein
MDPTAQAVLFSVAVVLYVAGAVQDLRHRPHALALAAGGLAVVTFVLAWNAWVLA